MVSPVRVSASSVQPACNTLAADPLSWTIRCRNIAVFVLIGVRGPSAVFNKDGNWMLRLFSSLPIVTMSVIDRPRRSVLWTTSTALACK